MVATWNTPLNNTQESNPPLASSSSSSDNDDHLADYHRCVERADTGVIGNKTSPARSNFDDVNPLDDIPLFAQLPFFDSLALAHDGFCDRYAMNSFLPVRIPLRALNTFAWCSHFSINDRDLHVRHGKKLKRQREAFSMTLMRSLFKYFTSPIEVPGSSEMDLFWYCTIEVMERARYLMDTEDEQLEKWRIMDGGEVTGSNEAYKRRRPQLRAEFRYVKLM